MIDFIHSEGGEYLFCITQNTCFDSCNALNNTFSQLSFERPIGFSQTTCFFASNALIACSACKPLGVQMFTTSISILAASNSSIDEKKGTSNSSTRHSFAVLISTIATNSASFSLRIISACLFPMCPAPTTANRILFSFDIMQ